jgi:hypothetical protein
MELQGTMIHLERKQKKALQKRAHEKGSSMSSEVRKAVDLYLSDLSPTEIAMLDIATKQAEKDILEINESMKRTIDNFDRAFDEIEHIQRSETRKAA